ncbi:zinc ribbon domain-containing protein [Amycolatopsis sp. NPDC024027]|uniref:zinc ribbon domain-containing protein n=1 Tax=Amycolatopsis sp. NPDC024027 TaxID=3154327 RepID=UPI0033CED149
MSRSGSGWRRSPRRFALAGLIQCGVCDRRLDSHRKPGRPTYRCRHGHSSTQRANQPRPKTLDIREDHLVDQLHIRFDNQGGHIKLDSDQTRSCRVAVALCDSGRFIVSPMFGKIMRS